MLLDQTQWILEDKRLKQVYQMICRELSRRQAEVNAYRKTVTSTGRSMWEESAHVWEYLDIDAAAEVKQSVDILKQESQKYEIAKRQLAKLEKLKRSCYFGRIDFTEKGYSDTEEIYIGIMSFFDEKGNIIIYDWRAPVSGIFYDFELGPASYKCPEGVIEGEVSLKRQYRIVEDSLEFMLDTGIKIDDELLQEILSRNTDEKMRNIVNTIQKEQNRIIRDEGHHLLMVQGVAGSGKTSIALHRIAYLLYKYRDVNLTSSNILIFSPNTVFNDYISNVLPELGEENMQQTTFDEYLEKMAGEDLSFEHSSSHMEFILTAGDSKDHQSRLKGINYKSTMDFYHLLNDYINYLEQGVSLRDIAFRNQVIVSQQAMRDMFYNDYGSMPLVKRLEKLKLRLYYLIRHAWYKRLRELEDECRKHPDYREKAKAYSRLFVYREFKPVRKQIEDMLSFDVYEAFCCLFEDTGLFARIAGDRLPEDYLNICRATAAGLRLKRLGYEDISAYVYFKGRLAGVPNMSHIRHVVVDEAQDYTPVQYAILSQLFPKTRMTLLGDFNQTVNPLKETFGYEQAARIMSSGNYAILRLTRGYRSTADIVDFTRCILKGNNDIESIQRHGEKPRLISADDEEQLFQRLIDDIRHLVDEGMESVGIICKTADASKQLYTKLRRKISATLLTQDDVNFSRDIMVLPVYLAKGLEFDAAIVYDADKISYGHDKDRKLLYTACTRALHRLHLMYTGEVTPLIADIPQEYYEVIK